jgi:hypothetical protein
MTPLTTRPSALIGLEDLSKRTRPIACRTGTITVNEAISFPSDVTVSPPPVPVHFTTPCLKL